MGGFVCFEILVLVFKTRVSQNFSLPFSMRIIVDKKEQPSVNKKKKRENGLL